MKCLIVLATSLFVMSVAEQSDGLLLLQTRTRIVDEQTLQHTDDITDVKHPTSYADSRKASPDCPSYPEIYQIHLDPYSNNIAEGKNSHWIKALNLRDYDGAFFAQTGELHQGKPVYETYAFEGAGWMNVYQTACHFNLGPGSPSKPAPGCKMRLWFTAPYWAFGPSDLFQIQPSSGILIRETNCLDSYDGADVFPYHVAHKTHDADNVYHRLPGSPDCSWMTSADGWGRHCASIMRYSSKSVEDAEWAEAYSDDPNSWKGRRRTR